MPRMIVFRLATPARPSLTVFPESNGGRITGGQNSLVDQFPYQVSIQWGAAGQYQHWCGGSIISPLYVLTAGHCVTGVPSFGRLKVNAGVVNVYEDGVVRDVASTLVHPLYEG